MQATLYVVAGRPVRLFAAGGGAWDLVPSALADAGRMSDPSDRFWARYDCSCEEHAGTVFPCKFHRLPLAAQVALLEADVRRLRHAGTELAVAIQAYRGHPGLPEAGRLARALTGWGSALGDTDPAADRDRG